MILGRTANKIKIKTDGTAGLRAVGCACCVECLCGSAIPINPPSDPDFTKKLRGDTGVTPFTQVSLNYNIISTFGSYSAQASGSMSGSWVDGSGCFNEPLKVFVGSSCNNPAGQVDCGTCEKISYDSNQNVSATAIVRIVLLNTGCLSLNLTEGMTIAGVAPSGIGSTPSDFSTGADCSIPDESGNLSITINGEDYPVVEFDPLGMFSVTASLNITFS